MILNLGLTVLRRPPLRTTCAASTIHTEQLRAQLDQLHSEAEKTHTKANNARLRLMRLSEAAVKLQRQAAISVQIGKENDARELLLQKRKVIHALEKSKSRIELLDDLCAKLNEAISIKETELIGNVSSDIVFGTEKASSPVRVVSPNPQTMEDMNESANFDGNDLKQNDHYDLEIRDESQTNQGSNNESENPEGSMNIGNWNEKDIISSLREISSYEEFVKHLDQQLNNIEADIVTVLRLSTLTLESQEELKILKLQQLMEILKSVRGIRGRIQASCREK